MLLCFDLDNTLINSDKAHAIAFNYALEKVGFKKLGLNIVPVLLGRPKEELVKIIASKASLKQRELIIKYHDSFLVKKSYKYAKRIPYTLDTIKKLRKDYKIALISNTRHKNILYLLKGAKFDKKYFDIIIGADDAKSKPSPDGILKIKKLIKAKEVFMIGDSVYDIIAGRKAKVKTVGVLSGHYSRSKLKKEKPDFIIKDLRKLPSLLNKLN